MGKNVAEVYESWDKLLDLKKVRAVENAQEALIAKHQKEQFEIQEKLKKEESERAAAEAALVGADV